MLPDEFNDDLAGRIRDKLDAGQEGCLSFTPAGEVQFVNAEQREADAAHFQQMLSARFHSSLIIGTRMVGDEEVFVTPTACLRGGWERPMTPESYAQMIACLEAELRLLRAREAYLQTAD